MARPLIDRAMGLIEEFLKDQALLKAHIRNQALCEEGERLIAEYLAGAPPAESIDTPGAKYEPWTNGWAVGYKVTHKNGKVGYVYFNPSVEEADDVPNVFLYLGQYGNAGEDAIWLEHMTLDPDDYLKED